MGQRSDTRNPCTQYNPLSSDNNTAGQQTFTNYPTAVSLNIETTPLTRTLYMNDITRETKGQAKRKNNEWQEPATSSTPNPNQGGHKISSLLN